MESSHLRRTVLFDLHRSLGARIVPFAGWEMPVQYSGILAEARAVRSSVGIFDISHMGRLRLIGAGAEPLLQRVTTNNVAALVPGRAQYSLLPTEDGGLLDDIIVYRVGGDEFLVVVNAGNHERDVAWLSEQNRGASPLTDESDDTAMIAIQGPGAVTLTAGLCESLDTDLPRFSVSIARLAGVPAVLCRTGYTGEDGYEAIVPAAEAGTVWSRLIESGALPCGLGARDALRIEAGFPLYGHEIDETTSPVEAGLMWAVSMGKGPFVGLPTIERRLAEGPARRLVGLTLGGRSAPRQGYTLKQGGEDVGVVTSGVFSPQLERGVGMAYVMAGAASPGTPLDLDVRGVLQPAHVVPKKHILGRSGQ